MRHCHGVERNSLPPSVSHHLRAPRPPLPPRPYIIPCPRPPRPPPPPRPPRPPACPPNCPIVGKGGEREETDWHRNTTTSPPRPRPENPAPELLPRIGRPPPLVACACTRLRPTVKSSSMPYLPLHRAVSIASSSVAGVLATFIANSLSLFVRFKRSATRQKSKVLS